MSSDIEYLPVIKNQILSSNPVARGLLSLRNPDSISVSGVPRDDGKLKIEHKNASVPEPPEKNANLLIRYHAWYERINLKIKIKIKK